MLIEIVQHECNKVVKEVTLEQALEYANNFTVNLVDSEGNRTPFVPADHAPSDGGEVGEPTAADFVTEEVATLPKVTSRPVAKKTAKKAS